MDILKKLENDYNWFTKTEAKALIRVLNQMAAIDGTVTQSEAVSVIMFSAACGLSADESLEGEALSMIQALATLEGMTLDKKRKVIAGLMLVSAMDQEVDESEKGLLSFVAASIGLT